MPIYAIFIQAIINTISTNPDFRVNQFDAVRTFSLKWNTYPGLSQLAYYC